MSPRPPPILFTYTDLPASAPFTSRIKDLGGDGGSLCGGENERERRKKKLSPKMER